MKIGDIVFKCDEFFSKKEKDYIYNIIKRAEPYLSSFLGQPKKNKWTISKFKIKKSYYETDSEKKIIYLGDEIFPYALVHEIVHAWHDMDLLYDFIEEGITGVVVDNISKELNFTNPGIFEFSKSKNFSKVTSFDPIQGTKADIHFLDFYRAVIITNIWSRYEKKSPGLISNIINNIRILSNKDDLKSIIGLVKKRNRALFEEFDEIFSVNLNLIKEHMATGAPLDMLGGTIDYGINKAALFVPVRKKLSKIISKNKKVYHGLVDSILKLPNDELSVSIKSERFKIDSFKLKALKDGSFGFKYDKLSPGKYNIFVESIYL